ncbi:MAG TPA: hypothetical protein V6D29_09460 [Leptolyngbyaceae cyanobacterium]
MQEKEDLLQSVLPPEHVEPVRQFLHVNWSGISAMSYERNKVFKTCICIFLERTVQKYVPLSIAQVEEFLKDAPPDDAAFRIKEYLESFDPAKEMVLAIGLGEDDLAVFKVQRAELFFVPDQTIYSAGTPEEHYRATKSKKNERKKAKRSTGPSWA